MYSSIENIGIFSDILSYTLHNLAPHSMWLCLNDLYKRFSDLYGFS